MTVNQPELDEIIQQAEAQLACSSLDIPLLSQLLTKLEPWVAKLTLAAQREQQAQSQLERLQHFFNEAIARTQQERLTIGTSLKELNTGRKASHNYDKNR
ncbi:hypothetical protein [Rheinheimera sp. UJ63]|uniref:hypothetical protein n=1 Tax=Rheinheimera sp. UJ63 TaxID=2910157 RepID=UPI001F339D55|nr:hypothetical protein [Rheinheimera sp. UJ63]MCF4009080.1 hypothetical protein [Rheinheimera sp. UJ63]